MNTILKFDPAELEQSLTTVVFGKKIYYRAAIGSTNDWARTLAERGEAEGAVCAADCQTQGKGRLGRGWTSPPGLGLWFSFILRPRLSPAELAAITVITAVAAAQAIQAAAGIQVQIKWPNDLVYQDRKLTGILAELSSEGDAVRFLILGVGINVNHTAADFPAELKEKATSLRMIAGGGEFSRQKLLGEFLRFFEPAYFSLLKGDVSYALEYATRHSATVGRTVVIRRGDGTIYRGEALGLEPDGSLRLRDETGRVIVAHSGEIMEAV